MGVLFNCTVFNRSCSAALTCVYFPGLLTDPDVVVALATPWAAAADVGGGVCADHAGVPFPTQLVKLCSQTKTPLLIRLQQWVLLIQHSLT